MTDFTSAELAANAGQKPFYFQDERGCSFVPNQTKSQVAGRLACGAPAVACVPDKVRNVGSVFSFDHTHAAAGKLDPCGATIHIKRLPDEAGVRPLPNISGQVQQAVFICAEAPDRSGTFIRLLALDFFLVARKPTDGRIRRCAGRQGVVVEARTGSENPFLVSWKPPRQTS